MRFFALIAFVTLLVVLQTPATQGQHLRTTATTKQLVSSLETNTDRFSTSVDAALDRSRLDDSNLENQFNALVDEFELATDSLKDQIDDDMVIGPESGLPLFEGREDESLVCPGCGMDVTSGVSAMTLHALFQPPGRLLFHCKCDAYGEIDSAGSPTH